ncbi:PAS domain-containing protein [Aurantiacibacter sediminis]|uniref:histidine kinase n=2 Tax=Aurantiacibacter sediminis TaxID=2793064 RepID=A0ABS0N2A0_9SPHN|nr:PAS domain-containing protein [Aurantiacibacter sediminis]
MESGVFILILGVTLSVLAIIVLIALGRLPSELANLRRSCERTKTTLLAAERLGGIGTWSIDLQTREIFWSKRVFDIHRRDPAKGAPAMDAAISYYHPSDREMVQRSVDRALARGDDYEFSARIICDDGEEKRVVSRGMCQTNVTGTVIAVFGIFIETGTATSADGASDNAPATGDHISSQQE